MLRLSAKWRINLGLASLLVSVALIGASLEIVPDGQRIKLEGRAQLCEALAVNSSMLVSRGDFHGLQSILEIIVQRNHEVHSAGIRRSDGHLLVEVGSHGERWLDVPARKSTDYQVSVPLWAESEPWGVLEVRFEPVVARGPLAFLHNPWTRYVGFVAAASCLLFAWYLGKMLSHLDPSKAVPGRVRSALDTLAEGLVVLNSRENIVLANRAFASTVGVRHEKLMGQRMSRFSWTTANDDQDETSYPWSRALTNGQAEEGIMLQLEDGPSGSRSFIVNCAPVLGHDGQYHGVMVSFEDVTQLEQKKVELARAMGEAESANLAKSEFLANMSHEIRTPMNAILGFTDVLRRGFEKSEQRRRQHLNTIHSSGEHLLNLINDILDLSKVESGKMEIEHVTCSPHQLVAEVLAVLGVKARERDITLEYHPDGPVPETVVTDPGRLRQTLMNLVGNAIKFTETGGVTVVARLNETSHTTQLAFDVIDTGIGMTPETQEKIFRPFAQADGSVTRRFGGTGLGLSISRRFAEALGGQLNVSSQRGMGSVFTLTIDTGSLEGIQLLTAEEARQIGIPDTVEDQRVTELPDARILVVDDGEENRELMTLVLQQAGAETETADNGRTAVELASSSEFDVVLMDMQMPIMDGYTAARTLRQQGYTRPIIALTAHAMKGAEEKCLAAGCSGFLSKPINIDRLIQTLAEVLGGKPRASSATLVRRKDNRVPTETTDVNVGSADDAGPLVSSLPTHKPQFAAIVCKFVARLDEQLEAMDSAFAAEDFSQLAQLAHWLKGSGGNVGFDAFVEPAKKLEQLAKGEQAHEVLDAIAHLKSLAERIVPPEVEPTAEREPVHS